LKSWAASAFVKPLTGSRGDFAQAVHGEAALLARYLDEVAQYYDAILIQPIVSGVEYRIFLLDDESCIARENIRRSCRAMACAPSASCWPRITKPCAPAGFRRFRAAMTLRSTPCWPRASAGRFPGG
jgi:hypothetical protein